MAHEEVHASTETNDQVVISIREELKRVLPLSSECCIYTVPKNLRDINADSYTPRVVSIGPLHRGKLALQAMEGHKLRYLNSFVCRGGRSLEDCVIFIRTKEEQARSYYEENINLSSDEFVQMILVDGCFLVELILSDYYGIGDDVDRIFEKPLLVNQIQRDLMLVENQLPFFILEDLYLFYPCNSKRFEDISFKELFCRFFYFLINTGPFDARRLQHNCKVKHCVDLLRFCYLPSSPMEWNKYDVPIENWNLPTVTQLREAGVRFKVGTSKSLLDIKFHKGVLEIPHIDVDEDTETLFRNLIAFEQCHNLDGHMITGYMQLMDGLIDTPEDVDLLIRHKIITSYIGSSEQVCRMYNNIGKEVFFRTPYFNSLCRDLKLYYQVPRHRWKAIMKHDFSILKRDYFNTHWKILSTIAAVVLLLLTLIQTVCSVISV